MDEHPENDQVQQTKRSKDAWWKGTEAKQRKRQKKPGTKAHIRWNKGRYHPARHPASNRYLDPIISIQDVLLLPLHCIFKHDKRKLWATTQTSPSHVYRVHSKFNSVQLCMYDSCYNSFECIPALTQSELQALQHTAFTLPSPLLSGPALSVSLQKAMK